MEVITSVVTDKDTGIRVDIYVARALDISRSYAGNLIKDGKVSMRDRILKANYRVAEGDEIVIEKDEAADLTVEAENIPLDIVYEDKDIIIVNKARGMVVHPAAGNPNGTLVNALLWHCGGELSGINGVIRPGIVHRLDKDTSGLMVAAKTDTAHKSLAEQIKSHTARRTYVTLVHGNIVEAKGRIDAPLGRHPKDRVKMAVNMKDGKDAITHFTVLERFGNYTLVQCRLETDSPDSRAYGLYRASRSK